MVSLIQVARNTSNHTINYSHLRQVRDMKIDFEIPFKTKFFTKAFSNNFLENINTLKQTIMAC
jgi:hypothetical protein